MSERVSVSVIVPIYNAERYLERTLEALGLQTLQAIEFILVDDGSSDLSPAICEKYASLDPRFKYVRKENGGVSSARNAGMALARGEYLMFCDADDIPYAQWAEILYNKAVADNADVVLCGYFKEANGVRTECPFPYEETFTSRKDIIERLIMPMCVWGYAQGDVKIPVIDGMVWRGAYNRSFIENTGLKFLSHIQLGEDTLFNLGVFSQSNRIACSSQCLYVYVETRSSITHTGYDKRWNEYLMLWQIAHEMLLASKIKQSDTLWHNFQLSRYAVNAIFDCVCSSSEPCYRKIKRIRTMLSDATLKQSVQNIPRDLSLKNKLLCALLKPAFAGVVWMYYQRAYDRVYGGRSL